MGVDMRTSLSQEALLWAQVICAVAAPVTLALAYEFARGYHRHNWLILKIMFAAFGASHILVVMASTWALGAPGPIALLPLSALALRSSVNDTLTSSWLPLVIAAGIGLALLYPTFANLGMSQLAG